MNTANTYRRDLTLTWLISVFALAMSIAIVDLFREFEFQRFLFAFFWMMIISLLSSIPAFIFFAITGTIVLKKEGSIRRKKGRLLLINYTDIFLTAGVMLAILFQEKFTSQDLFLLYPLGVLIISSSVAILLLPFKTITKNTSHETY